MKVRPPLKPQNIRTETTDPFEITLEPGPPAFCRCGKSNAFPLCDGTQNGKRFRLVSYKVAEKREIWLCRNGLDDQFGSANR